MRESDIAVSFVLHRTPGAEIEHAIACALGSRCSVEVIVIDNGGGGCPEPRDDRVRVITARRNLGYGRAHNLAIALGDTRAPFHLVANTDVSFGPDVLPRLMAFLRDRPDVAAVAPRVRHPDGRIQSTARLLPTPAGLVRRRLRFLARSWEPFVDIGRQARGPTDLPFLTGCFLLARRDLLQAIAGFDPRFFVYGEDVDLSRRLHRQGPTVLLPDVEIVHLFRSESEPSLLRFALLLQGYARYFGKWGWWRDAERDRFNRRALREAKAGAVGACTAEPALGRASLDVSLHRRA